MMKPSEAISQLKMLKRTVKEESNSDKAIDMALSALEKQEQDRWIPVTKRLPEEDKDMLVTVHFLGLKKKKKRIRPDGTTILSHHFMLTLQNIIRESGAVPLTSIKWHAVGIL